MALPDAGSVGLPIAGSRQMTKSGLVQQTAQEPFVKHLPGQQCPPHSSCLPLVQGVVGAAARRHGVAPRSAPASRARQAVRRDPVLPKRRVRRSKVGCSIGRSSVTMLNGETVETDGATGSMPRPRSLTSAIPTSCGEQAFSLKKKGLATDLHLWTRGLAALGSKDDPVRTL